MQLDAGGEILRGGSGGGHAAPQWPHHQQKQQQEVCFANLEAINKLRFEILFNFNYRL